MAGLLNLNLFLLCLMYFCVIYGLYFYLTWLPTYFQNARGFTPAQAGWLSGMVLLTGGVTTIFGGWLTDWLVKHYGLRVGRSIPRRRAAAERRVPHRRRADAEPADGGVPVCGRGGRGGHVPEPLLGDLPRHRRAVGRHGQRRMNTFGNLGGALSPLVVGYTLDWWGSWQTPLLIGGGVYIVGGLLTLLVNPRKPLTPVPARA